MLWEALYYSRVGLSGLEFVATNELVDEERREATVIYTHTEKQAKLVVLR